MRRQIRRMRRQIRRKRRRSTKQCVLLFASYWYVRMKLLRAIRTDGRTLTDSLSAAAVRDIVRKRGRMIGIPDLAPHDLRRTFSTLSKAGGAPIEMIQQALGHASIQTTERYLKTAQSSNAGDYIQLPNDYIQLKTKGTETK